MKIYRPRYTIALSTIGTARITFADGTLLTLYRQATAPRALRAAWRMYRKSRRKA